MAAPPWGQSGPVHNSGPYPGPPPKCFNCGGEHYLVNCPEQKRATPAGVPASPSININQHYRPNSGSGYGQKQHWPNEPNGPGANIYGTVAPSVFPQYSAPGASQQFGNGPASYGPPSAVPPYQQYPGPAPPNQAYPSLQASYPPNHQQYGQPEGTPFNNQPPPQPYNGGPNASQFGNSGYQVPPQNQYPQTNGPPNYAPSGFQNPSQQFAPAPVPAQYQQPVNPYPNPNNPYAGPSPIQNQTPQWNHATPTPSYAGTPFSQKSNKSYTGYKRDYSGPPRQQSRSHSIHTVQHEFEVEIQRTPQTPASVSQLAQSTPTLSNRTSLPTEPHPSNLPSEIMTASNADTSQPRRESTGGTQNRRQEKSATPVAKAAESPDVVKGDAAQYEDGELTEEDLYEQEFDWALRVMFIEQPPTENVRLAQPLSTTWESTPVPLLDHRLNNSVSRYARKDNLKDFISPIRSQPQWSYLKDDPVFSELSTEELVVPLHEVRAWMAARHGTELPERDQTPSPSRKRARSEEDEQEVIDNQIKLEAATEHSNGVIPNKRQKNEEYNDEDTIIVQTAYTPTGGPGTPTVGRAGSPSISEQDDVWAPQPGEGAASAPLDPTEALLASLGVSGSPKPVLKDSLPSLSIPDAISSTPSFADYSNSMSPKSSQPPNPNHVVPQTNPAYPNPPQGTPQQANPPFNNPYDTLSPQGQYMSGISPQVNTQAPQEYSSQHPTSYGSGMPSSGNALYYSNQPPRQSSFGRNMFAQGSAPHAEQLYGMPQQNVSSYNSHLQGVPPQQQHPPPAQYAQYAHPQGNVQYPNYPPHAAPQYPPYGNSSYAPPAQSYPPPNQYNSVPQRGNATYPQNSGPYPQNSGYYANNNPSHGVPNYSSPPNGGLQDGSAPYPTFYNNSHGFQDPQRQDSGYMSARGSYSNSSEVKQGHPTAPPPQQNNELPQAQPHVALDGANETPTPPKLEPEPEETNFFASLPSQFPRKEKPKAPQVKLLNIKTEGISGSGDETEESPLTPTSMEILGKLMPSNLENGKKADSLRQGEDGTMRKVKRPQPVVAAAYSRRW